MFNKEPERIKKSDLTAIDKALRRVECQSAGQLYKKGKHSRLLIRLKNNSDQLSKLNPVSSTKSQLERSLIAF